MQHKTDIQRGRWENSEVIAGFAHQLYFILDEMREKVKNSNKIHKK